MRVILWIVSAWTSLPGDEIGGVRQVQALSRKPEMLPTLGIADSSNDAVLLTTSVRGLLFGCKGVGCDLVGLHVARSLFADLIVFLWFTLRYLRLVDRGGATRS